MGTSSARIPMQRTGILTDPLDPPDDRRALLSVILAGNQIADYARRALRLAALGSEHRWSSSVRIGFPPSHGLGVRNARCAPAGRRHRLLGQGVPAWLGAVIIQRTWSSRLIADGLRPVCSAIARACSSSDRYRSEISRARPSPVVTKLAMRRDVSRQIDRIGRICGVSLLRPSFLRSARPGQGDRRRPGLSGRPTGDAGQPAGPLPAARLSQRTRTGPCRPAQARVRAGLLPRLVRAQPRSWSHPARPPFRR